MDMVYYHQANLFFCGGGGHTHLAKIWMFKKPTLQAINWNTSITGLKTSKFVTSPPATLAKVIVVLMSKHQYVSTLV
jgi:hypothetical protein